MIDIHIPKMIVLVTIRLREKVVAENNDNEWMKLQSWRNSNGYKRAGPHLNKPTNKQNF
jgi:hypothetical protein